MTDTTAQELVARLMQHVEDTMIDAKADYPSDRLAGQRITYDSDSLQEYFEAELTAVVSLVQDCTVDLRGAGYHCADRDGDVCQGVYGEGALALCEGPKVTAIGLHILGPVAIAEKSAEIDRLRAALTLALPILQAAVSFERAAEEYLTESQYELNAALSEPAATIFVSGKESLQSVRAALGDAR